MTKNLTVEDIGHGPSLCLFLDGVPVDDAVRAEGHEPNGYFWQGVAEFVRGDLSSRLEFDCEGSMFAAYGDAELLEQLATSMEPIFNNAEKAVEVIRSASATGFEFDD